MGGKRWIQGLSFSQTDIIITHVLNLIQRTSLKNIKNRIQTWKLSTAAQWGNRVQSERSVFGYMQRFCCYSLSSVSIYRFFPKINELAYGGACIRNWQWEIFCKLYNITREYDKRV